MPPSQTQPKASNQHSNQSTTSKTRKAAQAVGRHAQAKSRASSAAGAAAAAAGPEAAAAYQGARVAAKKTSNAVFGGRTYIRTLKIQWFTGIILIWLLPLVRPGFFTGFDQWISRMLAWTASYAFLLLFAGINPRVARVSAMLGWLPFLVLIVGRPGSGQSLGATVASDSTTRLENAANQQPPSTAAPNQQTFST